MRKFGKTTLLTYLMAAFALALLFVAVLPQQAQAADTDRYGYQQLESNKLKQLYVLIADTLADCQNELSLTGKGYKESDLLAVAEMVRRDYPEFFYYANYGYSFNSSGEIQSVTFRFMLGGKEVKGNSAELKSARTAFDKKVNEIVKGAKGTDYQKALYLHDYIVNNVIYQTTNDDQNAYGALIEGKSVCAGYSHAYQHLLRKVGIESFYITGTSRGIPHAWLLVFLNDECYYTDVTWDDPATNDGTQVLGHYYFDMSYDDISKDHTPDPEYSKWLPKNHNHKDMYYFEQEAREGSGVGWFNSNTAPAKLSTYLKKDGNSYYCDFRYDGSDLSEWLNKAVTELNDTVGGLTGYSYKLIGNECMLTITAKAVQHEVQKVDAKAATCIRDGNKSYYVCTKCGDYFEDANAKKPIVNQNSVLISKTGHTAGPWKSDANRHWKECTASGCTAMIPGTSATHANVNGDKNCDTCGYQISGSSSTTQTTPTTPPNNGPEATTPPNNATEATTPPVDATEGTTPPNDATEGMTPSTDATEETAPSADATEGTTPSTDVTEGTTPSTDATDGATDPTAPTQGKPSGGGELMDTTWIIIAGAGIAAVVIITIVITMIRKKRTS